MKRSDPRWPQPSSHAVSAAMRANRKGETAPEAALRSVLHRRGRRFLKNRRIPLGGRKWTQPDLVFPRARVAVFVDGCFWHCCPEHGTTPASNSSYWGPKLARNAARDRETDIRLSAMGWHVVRAWEHDDPVSIAERVDAAIAARTRN